MPTLFTIAEDTFFLIFEYLEVQDLQNVFIAAQFNKTCSQQTQKLQSNNFCLKYCVPNSEQIKWLTKNKIRFTNLEIKHYVNIKRFSYMYQNVEKLVVMFELSTQKNKNMVELLSNFVNVTKLFISGNKQRYHITNIIDSVIGSMNKLQLVATKNIYIGPILLNKISKNNLITSIDCCNVTYNETEKIMRTKYNNVCISADYCNVLHNISDIIVQNMEILLINTKYSYDDLGISTIGKQHFTNFINKAINLKYVEIIGSGNKVRDSFLMLTSENNKNKKTLKQICINFCTQVTDTFLYHIKKCIMDNLNNKCTVKCDGTTFIIDILQEI